jgi:2-C-methyl-D-erythritol 4-phosphate cytidylyltransferase
MSQGLHVIIPAAGTGSRMGSQTAKQYLPLAGKPVLHHSLALFCHHPQISHVYLALSPEDQSWAECAGEFAHQPKLTILRSGGESRAQTVLNTLQQISLPSNDWVLVHDAARPGLTATLLERLMTQVQHHAVGGLLALPVADTIKRDDGLGQVASTEQRAGLWAAQTPQMFTYQLLLRALQQADFVPTDESQAVEALGLSPLLVEGAPRNLKITYTHDLAILAAIMQAEG